MVIILLIAIGGGVSLILRKPKKKKKRTKTTTAKSKDVTPAAEGEQYQDVEDEPLAPEDDPNYKVDESGCEWWYDEGIW